MSLTLPLEASIKTDFPSGNKIGNRNRRAGIIVYACNSVYFSLSLSLTTTRWRFATANRRPAGLALSVIIPFLPLSFVAPFDRP